MAETSWPDPAASRIVTDIQWEQLASAGVADGIVGSPAQSSVIYADSTGRQVKVRSGKVGRIRGHAWYSGPADTLQPIGANATGQARVDLVVLRLNRSTWAAAVAVKAGTPGVATAPAAQQDLDASLAGAGVFEVPLATVVVGAGVTTINPSDVTPVSPVLSYAPRIIMPSVASLQLLPAPIPGMTAMVGDQLYLYSGTAAAWRRADWNLPWGIIGGKEYASTGTLWAAGIPGNGSVYPLGIDTGAVARIAGRRYGVRAYFNASYGTTGTEAVLRAVDTTLTGPIRANFTTPTKLTATTYPEWIIGEFTETTSQTVTTFGAVAVYGGTMNAGRTGDPNLPAFMMIEDLGPAAALTAIA